MPSFLGVCFILFLILNSKGLATDNSTFIKFDHISAFETKLYRSKYKIETLKKAKFIHFNKDDLVKHWPEHIPVTVGITNKQAFYVSYLPLMIPVIHEIKNQWFEELSDIDVNRNRIIAISDKKANKINIYKLKKKLKSIQYLTSYNIESPTHISLAPHYKMGAYVSNKQLFLFKHSNNKLTLYKDRSKLIETALKNKSISDIVFNNKNNLIVTADNEILFFDSRTGKLIKKIIHDTPMSTTRTTYHGEILSYDKANNELMYWDQDHTLLERFKNPHFEDDFTWRNFQFDPQYGHVIFYTNKEAYFYNMKSNFDKLSSVKKTNEYIKINYLLTFPAQLEIKLLNKKKKTIASCVHEKRNIHRRLNSNSNLSIIPSGKNKALCKLNNNKNQTLAFIQFTGKSFYSNPDKIKKIIPIKTKNR